MHAKAVCVNTCKTCIYWSGRSYHNDPSWAYCTNKKTIDAYFFELTKHGTFNTDKNFSCKNYENNDGEQKQLEAMPDKNRRKEEINIEEINQKLNNLKEELYDKGMESK
jgi:hypothetical protein